MSVCVSCVCVYVCFCAFAIESIYEYHCNIFWLHACVHVCIYYVHVYCSVILSAQEGRALEMVVRVLVGGAWCVCLRSSFLAPMSPAERCARLESVGEASDLGAYLAGSRLCFCHVYRTHTCSCRPHTLILTHSQQSLHTQLFFL